MRRVNNKGFTIIELLIATVVFSVVLLLITSAIIQIGRIYYKGVIQSRTQETARAVLQDVSQSVQFSRSMPLTDTVSGGFVSCIGDKRYTYRYGQQLGSGPGKVAHVLVADTSAACGRDQGYGGLDVPELDATTKAKELLGDNMQLVELTVEPMGSNLWQVTAHVAYGEDDDLLADKSGCKSITLGGQFCAVSRLTTTVTQRLK